MTTQMPPEGQDASLLQSLRLMMRGEVMGPEDLAYEDSRRVYNANVDRRPRIIARCRDTTDVIEAVNFARTHGMAAAIRGGGHNVAGLGTCDGELLIDLSQMRGTRVDPLRRHVHVQGGATIGDLDHATRGFGLAVPAGIVSTTGVAGLTLGGGFGYLTRQHGLTCDNLVSADVVTAEGRLVVTNDNRNPDLLWALRGGGGNFGVVTSFEFQAHPTKQVIGGPMFWPLEAARPLMKAFDDLIERAPHQLGAFFGYHIVPPVEPFPQEYHHETMCMLVICFDGPENEAREVLSPIISELAPEFDLTGPVPYADLQTLFDDLLPPGLHHYWKTVYLRELPEEAIEAHLEHGPKVANIHTGMHMYPLNGAVHRVGPRETAFNYRDVKYAVNIFGVTPEPTQFDAIRQWVRDYYDALEPASVGTGYVNFMDRVSEEEEADAMVRAAYGDNYDRLAEIKADWDPNNLFRFNHNIKPAGGRRPRD
ncbi:MAG: FAD-binding oxidoreductase [Persicimonas sp.]